MRSAWETRKRGSATYGNNSETACRQNAAKKRPPCTRAAERRGRGEREARRQGRTRRNLPVEERAGKAEAASQRHD